MKRVTVSILLLIPIILFAQNGSLTGNVFWKYNDFVGNKPDAGSEINVYSMQDTSLSYKAKCDVAGNFKIEKIKPGRYLVIVKSENTTQDPTYFSRLFKIYKYKMDTALNIKISEYRRDLQDRIDSTYDANMEMVMKSEKIKPKEFLKQSTANKNLIKNLQSQLFEPMPIQWKIKLPILSWIHKSFHFEVILIKDGETENIVVDFGNTFI